MHPHQDRVVPADLAHGEGQDHAVVHRGLVGDRVEGAVGRRQQRGRGPADQLVLLDAVLDQVLDGDHAKPVPLGELGELRQARHLALLVHDLADDAGRRAAGEPREVHGGLGVPGAPQHAAGHRPERQDVAGPRQVLRVRGRIDQRAHGERPVVRRGAGRHAALGVHRHREGRAHRRGVVRHHHADAELVEALARSWERR